MMCSFIALLVELLKSMMSFKIVRIVDERRNRLFVSTTMCGKKKMMKLILITLHVKLVIQIVESIVIISDPTSICSVVCFVP